jgi:hypothetical protein
VACVLALPSSSARGDQFEECYFEDAHFGCYIDADGWCRADTHGAVAGFPAVKLDEGPFVSVGDPRWRGWGLGVSAENPDADGDGLWDASETELARRFSVYVLNAWSIDHWGTDPSLGEPTVLFQVHPVRPDGEPCAYVG